MFDLVVVGMGASARGLDGRRTVLGALRPRNGMAVIFVQHLDSPHMSLTVDLFGDIAMAVQHGPRRPPERECRGAGWSAPRRLRRAPATPARLPEAIRQDGAFPAVLLRARCRLARKKGVPRRRRHIRRSVCYPGT